MPETSGFRVVRASVRRIRRMSALFVCASGAITVVVGVLVLVGWALGAPRLTSVLRGAVAMKANTALAVVLAGSALLLHELAPRRSAAARVAIVALAAVVLAMGLATAAEYLFGWDLRIDEALAKDAAGRYASTPGRMSPYTAAALACTGIALLLPLVRRWYEVGIAFGAVPAIVGVLWLVGYAWGAPELLTDQWLAPVALHTAVALVLLGAAMIVVRICRRSRPRSYRLLVDTIGLKVVGSVVAVVLALILVGGLIYSAAAEAAGVAARLAAARTFRERFDAFQADTAEAALAQRAYLLTGDPAQARRWSRWVAELPQQRAWFRNEAARFAPELQVDLLALDRAVAELKDSLERSISVYVRQGPAAARAVVHEGRSAAALASLREVVERVGAREHQKAVEDEQLLIRVRQRTLLISLLGWVAAAAMLGATVFAVAREMAARSSAERRLRRSSASAVGAHRFLQSVIQNIPHMIFIKEAKHLRFVLLNPAGEEIFGMSQPQVLGKNDADFFPPEQVANFVARDREVLERGEVLDIPEEEIRSPRLGTRVLHTKKIPLRDATGQTTHLLGISEDVTVVREQDRRIRVLNQELAARAAEVERLNQAKSEFLATMSHEIRTPMNGMLGTLELLSLTNLDRRQRDILSVVSESGQALLRIINDILDFSKIEAQKLEVREEVSSVAALLRDIRNIHAPLASSNGVVLGATIDSALSPASWVDSVRLRQVLNNFASNAVKFTRSGEVEIRVEVLAQTREAQTVRFSVRDTGPGISPEEQRRLFSPFVQVGDPRGRAFGGSGLGLVIARQLVELMGGTVTLESAPGAGTTVCFTIVLRRAPPELLPKDMGQQTAELRELVARVRPAPDVDQAEAQGTLVLVVDDHPVNRMLLRDQLGTLGYACESAQDGSEALRKWRSGRFGLVLTDCHMPGMDGYELARRIREDEVRDGLPRAPIIACTAAAGELREALAAGMDDTLVKPVQLADIRDMLDRWLPVSSRAGATAVIDISRIEANWGSDPETVASIQQAFVTSVKDDTNALRAAASRRDFDAVRQFAHRMLGASGMVGAQALAEICERLQMASRHRDVPALAEAVADLESECARVVRELG